MKLEQYCERFLISSLALFIFDWRWTWTLQPRFDVDVDCYLCDLEADLVVCRLEMTHAIW